MVLRWANIPLSELESLRSQYCEYPALKGTEQNGNLFIYEVSEQFTDGVLFGSSQIFEVRLNALEKTAACSCTWFSINSQKACVHLAEVICYWSEFYIPQTKVKIVSTPDGPRRVEYTSVVTRQFDVDKAQEAPEFICTQPQQSELLTSVEELIVAKFTADARSTWEQSGQRVRLRELERRLGLPAWVESWERPAI